MVQLVWLHCTSFKTLPTSKWTAKVNNTVQNSFPAPVVLIVGRPKNLTHGTETVYYYY